MVGLCYSLTRIESMAAGLKLPFIEALKMVHDSVMKPSISKLKRDQPRKTLVEQLHCSTEEKSNRLKSEQPKVLR